MGLAKKLEKTTQILRTACRGLETGGDDGGAQASEGVVPYDRRTIFAVLNQPSASPQPVLSRP